MSETPPDEPRTDIAAPLAIESANLRAFHAYWLGRLEADRLPARDDIDPLDFPALLPFTMLVDVLRDEETPRFSIRVFGTRLAELAEQDFTGKTVEAALPQKQAEEVLANYREVVATGRPHVWRSHVRLPGREFISYERLALPLAADGETVDMLIVVFDFALPS